jgi:uncharacterized protein (TIGR02145 family)
MIKKMNFSRFCRRGLAALPVFLALMACDQAAPPSLAGSGKWVSVKIGAINIAGGAQNKIVRAGGGEQKRVVGEPIVQDMGGGMLAEITVEEDVSALREAPAPESLETDKTFRVIALKSSDKTYLSHADFKVGSSSKPSIYVPDDVECNFVCYSYNNSDALPEWSDGDLSALSVDNSKDLLWGEETSGAQYVTNSTELEFTLSQQLAKVKLKLDVNTNASRTIMSISANSIHMKAPTSGSFNLASGVLSAGSDFTNYFGWPETLGAGTATSGEFTFLPKASGSYTLSWTENAVTALENSTIQRSLGGPGSITVPYSQFKAGYSYTIGLKFYRLPRFAGSNIYWDSAKSQLTFDPHGSNANTKYQGVYFQWGSLIGIAAGPNTEAYSSTVLYWPDNVSNRTWKEVKGAAWTDIPYYIVESTYDKDQKPLLDNPDFTNYKGDICNYIDEDYRMPTGLELDSLCVSYKGFALETSDAPGTSDNDKAGKHVFTSNYGTLTGYVLPASGCRNGSTGTLYDVGIYGYYWSGSGSATNSSYAYELRFGSDDAIAYGYSRSYGRTVRCVKN